MNIIQSRRERQKAGVGMAYVDTANQANMAQYNNEFNYWLWLQQMKYNSPEQQRARLEAAGLNPNFQSVDSGNVSAIPTSSGSVAPSVGRNSAAQMQNTINSFNALVKSIGEGISDVSRISGIPDNISGYRKLLSSYMFNKVGTSELERTLRTIETMFGAKSKLGIDLGWSLGATAEDGSIIPMKADWESSPVFANLGLKNEDLQWLVKLRQYDFEKMKPEERKLLIERADLIAEQAGLTGQQSRFFSAIATTKIGSMIAPLVLAFFKGVL